MCKHIIFAYITAISWLCEIKLFFYIWMCCEDVAPPPTHTCEGHELIVHNAALFILSKSVNKEFQSKLSTKKNLLHLSFLQRSDTDCSFSSSALQLLLTATHCHGSLCRLQFHHLSALACETTSRNSSEDLAGQP